MNDVDELCDRVAIINRGEIIKVDTPENLKNSIEDVSILDITVSKVFDINTKDFLENSTHIVKVNYSSDKNVTIEYKKCEHALSNILSIMHDLEILQIDSRKKTLEDVYINLVGE